MDERRKLCSKRNCSERLRGGEPPGPSEAENMRMESVHHSLGHAKSKLQPNESMPLQPYAPPNSIIADQPPPKNCSSKTGKILTVVSAAIYVLGAATFITVLVRHSGGGIASLGPAIAAWLFALACLALSFASSLIATYWFRPAVLMLVLQLPAAYILLFID